MTSQVASQDLPPFVTAYLRRATWGLPSERQQEVWDELEEHLLGRAAQLQVSGLTSPEAFNRALAELGSPARVSAGMTGVYLMPKLVLIVGAGALMLSAALYALAGGERVVTLPILQHLPLPVCENVRPEQIAGTIVSNWRGTICYFPASTPPPLLSGGTSKLEQLVDQQTVEEIIKALGGTTHLQSNGVLELSFPYAPQPTAQWRVTTRSQGRNYFLANILVQGQAPHTQTLSGYRQPLIQVGAQVWAVGDGSDVQVGPDFYNSAAINFIGLVDPGAHSSEAFTGGRTHHVQTPLKAGEVVMAITHSHDDTYLTTFAPVGDQGEMALKVNPARLNFVTKFSQLRQKQSTGRTPALLVRVTHVPLDKLKSGIFVPQRRVSDAVR